MQNKKTIMAFSAFFILIYHLWINLTNAQIEIYLRQICVIGVDLFFFISAYSIGRREQIDYKSFIKNRFFKIYVKFIVFSIIGTVCFHWTPMEFIKTILGIELFKKGGGSFLWFLPSIMFVYLTLPLYKKIDTKYSKITPFLALFLYFILSVIVSIFTAYKALFILTNRIPIILLGYYFAKYNIVEYLSNSKVRYWIITLISLLFGITISYFVWIFHFHLTWFRDLFYILYIPLIIGFALLLDSIKVNKFSEFMGSITLELYGLQMLFGFKIASTIFKFTNIKIISNILTIFTLIIVSSVIYYLFNLKAKFKLKKNEPNKLIGF